jgi:hypothetical protein
MKTLVKRIKRAEKRGAPIFSFLYEGTPRNVQIGTVRAIDNGAGWGTFISKSVVEHGNRQYIVAEENNKRSGRLRPVRRFRVDKISRVRGL